MPLDRETKTTYSLEVKAFDRPSRAANQRSSVVFVNVTLTDVNDNKPVFLKGSYYAAVMETASIGDDVITLKSTDADAGLYRRFFFNVFKALDKYFKSVNTFKDELMIWSRSHLVIMMSRKVVLVHGRSKQT